MADDPTIGEIIRRLERWETNHSQRDSEAAARLLDLKMDHAARLDRLEVKVNGRLGELIDLVQRSVAPAAVVEQRVSAMEKSIGVLWWVIGVVGTTLLGITIAHVTGAV